MLAIGAMYPVASSVVPPAPFAPEKPPIKELVSKLMTPSPELRSLFLRGDRFRQRGSFWQGAREIENASRLHQGSPVFADDTH